MLLRLKLHQTRKSSTTKCISPKTREIVISTATMIIANFDYEKSMLRFLKFSLQFIDVLKANVQAPHREIVRPGVSFPATL